MWWPIYIYINPLRFDYFVILFLFGSHSFGAAILLSFLDWLGCLVDSGTNGHFSWLLERASSLRHVSSTHRVLSPHAKCFSAQQDAAIWRVTDETHHSSACSLCTGTQWMNATAGILKKIWGHMWKRHDSCLQVSSVGWWPGFSVYYGMSALNYKSSLPVRFRPHTLLSDESIIVRTKWLVIPRGPQARRNVCGLLFDGEPQFLKRIEDEREYITPEIVTNHAHCTCYWCHRDSSHWCHIALVLLVLILLFSFLSFLFFLSSSDYLCIETSLQSRILKTSALIKRKEELINLKLRFY